MDYMGLPFLTGHGTDKLMASLVKCDRYLDALGFLANFPAPPQPS